MKPLSGSHSTPRFDPNQLPYFEADAALWPRIVAAQQQRVSRKRWQLGAFGAAAAAAVFAVVLVGPLHRPLDAGDGGFAIAAQRESQSLESEWLRLTAAGNAASGTSRVRVIDAELQAAYDRGANKDELAPLWQQRNDALRGLIAGMQAGATNRVASITRI